MHYKVKNVLRKKDGSIFLTVADSNIRPVRYYSTEYAGDKKDPEEKLFCLLMDIIEGNFVCTPGCNYRDIEQKMARMKTWIRFADPWCDRLYGVERTHIVYMQIAKFAYDAITNGGVWPGECWMEQEIARIEEETKKVYENCEKDLERKGVVLIRSAIWCEMLPEYDILISNGGDCILAKRDRYDNHGHLDNSDKSAMYLSNNPEDSDKIWKFFANGTIENHMPEIDWSSLSDIPGISAVRFFYERGI